MSKRQEMRERRKRERARNRVIIVLLVIGGALLIALALILPGIQQKKNADALATQAASSPVIIITPEAYNAPVNGTSLGDPNAPVRVDIFSDFRCSACRYYTTNIEPGIIHSYVETGKVYYSIHSFIVIDSYDNSGASLQSANAAMCAAEQGLFWPYHATLFANQVTEDASLFTDERLIAMAKNVNVEITSFTKCLQDRKYNNAIQADINQGNSLGLNSTPSLLVDGVKVENMNQLAEIIDAALASK